MVDVHELIMAKLAERDAEWDEHDRLEQLVPRGRKRVPGPTTVYSIRLDHDEVRALQIRAARVGAKPSTLARNLIRCGLSLPVDEHLSAVVDRVDAAMEELRAFVP
jgi:hypothetical protein